MEVFCALVEWSDNPNTGPSDIQITDFLVFCYETIENIRCFITCVSLIELLATINLYYYYADPDLKIGLKVLYLYTFFKQGKLAGG